MNRPELFLRMILSHMSCMLPLIIVAALGAPAAMAAGRTVDCQVTVNDENGDPLMGAIVEVSGTDKRHTTGVDGDCLLTAVSADASLLVSYLGYEQAKVAVDGRDKISVSLKPAAILADEVVVVGYGVMRKRDLSGSIAQLDGEKLKEVPSMSVAGALQGRIAGVQISQNTGQPGANMQIRVRGANSIKGSNEPLWIINGFPGDIDMINNADIESIEVLKDASATAIYGSRGANGVIIVTTRGAQAGDLSVNYRGRVGMQRNVKSMEMMQAWDYMEYLNTKAEINNMPMVYTPAQIGAQTESYNWQKEIFRTGLVTEHALTVNGGNERFQGTAGFSFFDQTGIIVNSGYSRLSFNTNLKYRFSKYVSADASMIYSRSDRDQLEASDVIYSALSTSPLAFPKKDNGQWNDFLDEPISPSNAAAIIHEKQLKWYSNRLLANASVTVRPIDGLSIQIAGNMLNKDNRSDIYVPTTYKEGYEGKASISFGNTVWIANNNIVTYDKTFGKHHLNVMGGVTYETQTTKSVSTGDAMGFISDAVGTFDLDAAEIKGLPTSSYSNWKMLSFLGRINYNFNSRYLLTVNFRADGSSRFSRGNKWGYFPSVAAAWRLSQEEFMQDITWLNDLKIRAGHGVTGSTSIAPYSTMNTLSPENVVFDDRIVVAYAPSYTYTGDLKWERNAQTDVGLDLSLFNNRLRFTLDYYYKKTTNLLNNMEMPRSSGYTTALRNIGSLSNQGFEAAVDATILNTDVTWDLGVNFSLNRSKVLNLSDHMDIFGSSINAPNGLVSGQLNLIREGEPMYVFYGYRETGYDDEGRIVYKDIDGDGNITPLDREIIGDPNPDFNLNINTTLRYKRFSLSAFFQGSFGNDIYGISMATYAYRYNYSSNALKEVMSNYWTPERPAAKYPNLLQDINLKLSDRFVYDGSYMRLKNLEIGYDIPTGSGKAVKKARVTVSAQNLFTITHYPFWDPDVNSNGGDSSITQGIDATSYPSARTFMIGVDLTF